ncbi:MAG: branched-chain amino acid transaminase [Coriobacteriales bacterium]|jgi:branched-chain amino acid aminotransferase
MAAVVESEYIWYNGKLVPWADATTHVLTHALHYGTAVFEGMRCYSTDKGSSVFRLHDHMNRLIRSGKMILMPIPYTADELCEATKEMIKANKLESCYVRPIAFRGYGSMGVDPRDCPVEVAIAAWPWAAYLGQEALDKGISVAVSSWRQRSANATPGAIKSSASYLNSGLAHMEVAINGYGEAILLNESGMVAEGSGENVFIVRDGELLTPPLSDGCLAGITRDSIIKVARDAGYSVREQSLLRTDLYVADEMFMSGSAAELTPVNSVDGREIPCPGKITKDVQARFFDVLNGKNEKFAAWNELI